MVNYTIVFSKQAQKDARKLRSSNLKSKGEKLVEILRIWTHYGE